PDSAGVVRPRFSCSRAELSRAGCPSAAQSRRKRASLLFTGTALGAISAHRACHAGHGDCVASGDLRRIFADAAGGATRIRASPGDPTYFSTRARTDPHSVGELAAAVLL